MDFREDIRVSLREQSMERGRVSHSVPSLSASNHQNFQHEGFFKVQCTEKILI